MSRPAYRLWIVKNESTYTGAGFSLEEAVAIINMGYDIDEDFTSKKDYIDVAKSYAQHITDTLMLSHPLDWRVAFGIPASYGYRYCSKCDTFYWDGDECCCALYE